MNLIPVIISGGAGSRLWPLSRELHPKPFIPLPDGSTLIRKVYARATGLAGVRHVVTVTNRELLFQTDDEYAAAPATKVLNSFVLEPFGRDTAAAIAMATLYAADAEGPDTVLLVLPADHLIPDTAAFGEAVQSASALAAQGKIVTFGIKAERPETAFGYIEAKGDRVLRFVEKPDARTAADYVASGRFFWNSGMFCFAVRTMMEAMQAHCSEVLAGAKAALERARKTESGNRISLEIDKEAFAQVPAISIDYAVMEKVHNIGFVPCTFDWSDIGSWNAMSELVPADDHGNRVKGEALLHDSMGCFVQSGGRLVGLAGVSDLVVIDTPDALLVAHKESAQDVKNSL